MIRILLIEDDEHIAQSIQFFLEGEGFQIKVAAMARQAMELLKSEDFQLVILDVTLPDGNGFELFEEIKARKELPVIANGTIYSDGKVDGTLRPYECKVMRSI